MCLGAVLADPIGEVHERRLDPAADVLGIAEAQFAVILDAILEQVGAAIEASLEQLHGVQRLGVLTEDHDADSRVG